MSESGLERSLIDNFVDGAPLHLLEDAFGKSAAAFHQLLRTEIAIQRKTIAESDWLLDNVGENGTGTYNDEWRERMDAYQTQKRPK